MFTLKASVNVSDFMIVQKSAFGGGMSVIFAKKAQSYMVDDVFL